METPGELEMNVLVIFTRNEEGESRELNVVNVKALVSLWPLFSAFTVRSFVAVDVGDVVIVAVSYGTINDNVGNEKRALERFIAYPGRGRRGKIIFFRLSFYYDITKYSTWHDTICNTFGSE